MDVTENIAFRPNLVFNGVMSYYKSQHSKSETIMSWHIGGGMVIQCNMPFRLRLLTCVCALLIKWMVK